MNVLREVEVARWRRWLDRPMLEPCCRRHQWCSTFYDGPCRDEILHQFPELDAELDAEEGPVEA